MVEIAQVMSPTVVEEQKIVGPEGEERIIITKIPGDFVVCNLSSVNLARAVPAGVLKELIPIQVLMLDNVIDLNNIEVLQAQLTNKRYRGIGLGTLGWHHLLALEKIAWNSERAVERADELYEEIAFLTIQASADISVEKGAYPYFQGSDWQTGDYFTDREYLKRTEEGLAVTERARFDWLGLYSQIAETGLRNGNLMAVAPNGSTAFIAGSTQSIDPVFKKVYNEEKKDFKIPVTVPDLNEETYWYYTSAYNVDQIQSMKQNIARQRHIDQSQSFNIYVRKDVKASALLELRQAAWRMGAKTTYYVRSTSLTAKECEGCV